MRTHLKFINWAHFLHCNWGQLSFFLSSFLLLPLNAILRPSDSRKLYFTLHKLIGSSNNRLCLRFALCVYASASVCGASLQSPWATAPSKTFASGSCMAWSPGAAAPNAFFMPILNGSLGRRLLWCNRIKIYDKTINKVAGYRRLPSPRLPRNRRFVEFSSRQAPTRSQAKTSLTFYRRRGVFRCKQLTLVCG